MEGRVWGTGRHCHGWKRTAALGREPPSEPGIKRMICTTKPDPVCEHQRPRPRAGNVLTFRWRSPRAKF